jgi:hypothetical protein
MPDPLAGTMPGSGALRAGGRIGARLLCPFYRRFPYRGPMDLFKLDPRGAYSPLEPFFYNRIPKAANTTITQVLFEHTRFRPRQARRTHPKYQFLRPLWLSSREVLRLERQAWVFTVVRNPYSRVLSAYLDKVVRRRHQGLRFLTWAARHSQPESFLGFCRYLEAGGLFLDMHWAPQADILCLPLERFDFIGRVETLEEDLAHILQHLYGPEAGGPAVRAGTTTGASARLDEAYGPEERQIVNRLYGRDFDQFGYDRRL